MGSQQRGHVHQTLRQATQAAHHALDHHPLLQRLTGSGLTLGQYAESLAAMYPAHARLEQRVLGSRHRPGSGLELSARVPQLAADLLELGWRVPQVPRTGPDPLDQRADWWGRVYVLEGSRRGSALLARCVEASLGGSAPNRFFAGAMLPDNHGVLLEALERELQDPGDLEQAAESARAAFAAYRAGLDAFESG